MPYFTQTLHCNHSGYTVLAVKSVGQRACTTRQSQSPRSCDSSPSDGQGGASTGNAAARAFAFLGRCFVVRRREKQTRLTDRLIRLPDGGRSQMAGNCRGLRVGVASDPHHKAPFCRQGAALTQQMGECRRRTQRSDAAHDPSGAALCRDRSEPALRPTMRLAHERAPASTNAPLHARSRPTVLFHRCLGWLKGSHVGSLGVNLAV